MTKYTPLPILTFVGRPLDPNKGLITFLDALELLNSLPCPPRFLVWIIGGDDDELPHIHALLAARPRLMKETMDGSFFIWGKIKRDALPEFYRRSQLVIMPSLREQFGLVAIEAMACGVPVIGTKQGGIDDTVLSGLTGAKIEIDQPDALAGALLLYLREPNLRITRGRLARSWARMAFSKKNVYARMAELYTNDSVPELDTTDWKLSNKFHEVEIINRMSSIETMIDRDILDWKIVAARHHIVAKLETSDGAFALKVFRDRPSLTTAIFPVGHCFPIRTSQDFVDNAIYHSNNPYVPPLIAYNHDLGTVIYSWVDTEPFQSNSCDLRIISHGFGEYGKINEPQLENYLSSLDTFLTHRDELTLERLDLAAAELNRTCQQANLSNRTSHPMAELTRISFCLENKGWPIPDDIASRIRMVINLLLSKWIPSDELPKLQHGDLKSRHLMMTTSGLMVVDTEHSVFAVGELDLGTYAAGEVMHGANIFNAVRTIGEATETKAESFSALQWMAYYLILGYLSRVHHGKTSEPAKVIRHALTNLALALS